MTKSPLQDAIIKRLTREPTTMYGLMNVTGTTEKEISRAIRKIRLKGYSVFRLMEGRDFEGLFALDVADYLSDDKVMEEARFRDLIGDPLEEVSDQDLIDEMEERDLDHYEPEIDLIDRLVAAVCRGEREDALKVMEDMGLIDNCQTEMKKHDLLSRGR